MKQLVFYFSCAVFFFLSIISSGQIESVDGMLYAAVAQNISRTGKPNAPTYSFPEKNISMAYFVNKHGQEYSPTGLGYSLAIVPAVVISDIIRGIYNVPQTQYFPLETDFLLHFFGGMINAFFGALFVAFFALLLEFYGFTKKESLLLSAAALFTTFLVVLTKSSFAHMMTVSFFTMTYYFIKKAEVVNDRKWYLFAGASFGALIISYNMSTALTFPFLFSIFLAAHINKRKRLLSSLFIGLIGVLPFFILFTVNNFYRTGEFFTSGYGASLTSVATAHSSHKLTFEGIWGTLFSPGRSIFIYAPILIFPILFWKELPIKKYSVEFFAGAITLLLTIFTYSKQPLVSNFSIWHGESSWGPRYLGIILPILLLLSFLTWKKNKSTVHSKIFFFLLLCGFIIQIPAILTTYQLKFAGLPSEVEITKGVSLTQYDIGNFFPRYQPWISLSSWTLKNYSRYPSLLFPSNRNFIISDGALFPDFFGNKIVRQLKSPTTFIWKTKTSENNILLEVENYVDDPSSSTSAQIIISYNGNEISNHIVLPTKSLEISTTIEEEIETAKLDLFYYWVATDSAKQKILLHAVSINNEPQNIAITRLPHMDALMQKLNSDSNSYWSTASQWDRWENRSKIQLFTPDIWWLRFLLYSDVPAYPVLISAFLLFIGLISSLWKLYTHWQDDV